jgi:hypothetical protein
MMCPAAPARPMRSAARGEAEGMGEGGWGKRGPAIPGREVEFEVQSYYDKHWVTESSFDQEKDAIAFAKTLFTDDKIEEVKVIRYRGMMGGGLSLKKEIFTEKRPPKPKKAVTLTGKITETRACTTMDELMGLESRIVMNRVLREFLDHLMITPTELLHNYSYQKKLDSMGLIASAVAQLAQAQSGAGQGDIRARIDEIYKLVNQVMYKAQETMSERKRIPVLVEGQYAQLCRRIEAIFPDDQRAYMVKTALTSYLNGAGSLGAKLEQIAKLVTDEVNKAQVAHLDDLIADILGSGSIVQDMLGDQPSLGAALGILADLVLNQLDMTKVKKPTPSLQMIHGLLNGRGLPSSKAVLLDRLRREFVSAKPMIRTNDPTVERETLNALLAKLAPGGQHIFGPEFEAAASKRSQAIRRDQLQKLGIAT